MGPILGVIDVTLRAWAHRFTRERGQAMIEYALIISLIVIVVLVVLIVLGNVVKNMYSNVGNAVVR
jgi:Flp pilus assembly pilin Flp